VIDWTIVADLGTAAGTALLAAATFASTRSANRSARSAERALLEGLRPILMPSQWGDSVQKINFMDGVWMRVHGGRASVKVTDDAAYVVMSLHNAGQGLAVLHGWHFPEDRSAEHANADDFHQLTRDIYIPSSGLGFGQIAVRDVTSQAYAVLADHVARHELIIIDLLYGDAEGSQRAITRFSVTRSPAQASEDDDEWALAAARHWNLNLPAPR
jgi:hypothetical protein